MLEVVFVEKELDISDPGKDRWLLTCCVVGKRFRIKLLGLGLSKSIHLV